MEINNVIIQNFANSIVDAASYAASKAAVLGENANENDGVIKILNVLIESVRAQTVLLQQAIDNYK